METYQKGFSKEQHRQGYIRGKLTLAIVKLFLVEIH